MGLDIGSVENFIAKTLPWIGAAATGNVPVLIGLAAKALGDATGMNVDPTVKGIQAAVAGATPEQAMQFTIADNDFKLKAEGLGFTHIEELAKLSLQEKQADAADYADARKNNADNKNYWVLAYLILASFALVMALVLLGCYKLCTLPATDAINMTFVAVVSGLVGAIVGYLSGNAQTVVNSIFGGLLKNDGKALNNAITQLGQSAPAIK